MSMIRTRWAAVGAAVAVTLGAGGIGLVDAAKGSGERPVTVTIEPCRLRDTRPDRGIGGRTAPLGPTEAYTVQGTGPSGNCNIPGDATGLVLNVTAAHATDATNLRLYPTGTALPTTSNLNPRPGAPPTPNGVTVGLNGSGEFDIRNANGTVHVIIDATAYLVDHTHDDRYYTRDEIDTLNQPIGTVTTVAGEGVFGFMDGVGLSARFNGPYDVAVAADDTVYVADSSNDRIRAISPDGVVTTLAGSGTPGFADGTGTSAQFYRPTGVAVAPDGTIYVADRFNHRIRRVTPAGVVTTFAGSGTPGFADGTGTTAKFLNPYGVAVGTDGTVYVADTGNNRVRRITPSGAVTTLAGSGTWGFSDGTGAAAQFASPHDVAVAADGTVSVADTANNRIRRITPAGVVTTLAGNGMVGSADGTGTTARLNEPYGVAVGPDGTVYVADTYNQRIRRITPDGVTTTLAGSGAYAVSDDGVGRSAGFFFPSGVAVAPDGSLRIGDTANQRIRRID